MVAYHGYGLNGESKKSVKKSLIMSTHNDNGYFCLRKGELQLQAKTLSFISYPIPFLFSLRIQNGYRIYLGK